VTYVKWIFWIILAVLVAAFLHYTLPQTDIVRISDTYEKRIDYGSNSIFWSGSDNGSAGANANRDVFFIQTVGANGKPNVYRNEDTGWGWPPYFKFDTATLQAEAADLRSTRAATDWVALRHYGWRSELLSIYPNAVSVRAVDSPEVTLIPWFNIIFLIVLFAAIWAIRVRWRRFRASRAEPDDFASVPARRGWFSRWRNR
jgi:hypothetical protein